MQEAQSSLTEKEAQTSTVPSHFTCCLMPLQKLVARDQQCSRSVSAQELGKQYPSKKDWSGPPYSHQRLCRKQDEGEDANSGILFFKRTLLLTKLTYLFLTLLLFWESYYTYVRKSDKVPQVLQSQFIFLHSFFFLLSDWIISVNLSSSSFSCLFKSTVEFFLENVLCVIISLP